MKCFKWSDQSEPKILLFHSRLTAENAHIFRSRNLQQMVHTLIFRLGTENNVNITEDF